VTIGEIAHAAKSITVRLAATLIKTFRHKQGQYLAFIYAYARAKSAAPVEMDVQLYFKVNPLLDHQMVLAFEHEGLIRAPAQGRPQYRNAH